MIRADGLKVVCCPDLEHQGKELPLVPACTESPGVAVQGETRQNITLTCDEHSHSHSPSVDWR